MRRNLRLPVRLRLAAMPDFFLNAARLRRLRQPFFAAALRFAPARRRRQPFFAANECRSESPCQAFRLIVRLRVVRFAGLRELRFGAAFRRLLVIAARRLRHPFFAAALRFALVRRRAVGFRASAFFLAVVALRRPFFAAAEGADALERVRLAAFRFGAARRVVDDFLRAARAFLRFLSEASRCAAVCAFRLMLGFLRLVTELVRLRAELVFGVLDFRSSRFSAAFALLRRAFALRPVIERRAVVVLRPR